MTSDMPSDIVLFSVQADTPKYSENHCWKLSDITIKLVQLLSFCIHAVIYN